MPTPAQMKEWQPPGSGHSSQVNAQTALQQIPGTAIAELCKSVECTVREAMRQEMSKLCKLLKVTVQTAVPGQMDGLRENQTNGGPHREKVSMEVACLNGSADKPQDVFSGDEGTIEEKLMRMEERLQDSISSCKRLITESVALNAGPPALARSNISGRQQTTSYAQIMEAQENGGRESADAPEADEEADLEAELKEQFDDKAGEEPAAPVEEEAAKAETKPELSMKSLDRAPASSVIGNMLRHHKAQSEMHQELSGGGHHAKKAIGHAIKERLLDKLLDAVIWWESVEEPVRSGRVHRVVVSTPFEGASAFMIILNSCFVAYSTDWQVKNHPMPEPEYFSIVEYCFTMFYVVELMLRLCEHRCYFFTNHDLKWNIFDFVLVTMSVCDVLVKFLVSAEAQNNITFMRILRLCKLAKILRALRAVRFFKDLAIMLDSFRCSFIALFWSSIMLIFMLYIFALIFLQAVVDYIVMHADELTPAFKEGADMYFGSMMGSILSLYMSVTGGQDWVEIYSVIYEANVAYAVVFVFFTFFFTFALFNIMTGMFVEKAVTSSTPDRNEIVLKQRQKARQTAAEFRHMCHVLDKDGSGTISWEEFSKHMESEVVATYMAAIGLEVTEIELFFNIVAGSADEGEVTIDQFVDGCMQMKGGATAIDMQRQLFEMDRMHKDVKRFENKCMSALEQLCPPLGLARLVSPISPRLK